MHWMQLAPLLLAGGLFLVVPGYAMSWALRLPFGQRLALAPMLSISLVGVSAVLAGMLGIGWSPLAFFGISAACIVIAALITVVVRRLAPPDEQNRADRRRTDRGRVLFGLIGFLVAAVSLALQTKKSLINPDSVSQSYDNIFHLNAIRYIAETGNASSLNLGAMTTADGSPSFYPAAWHDVTSLIFSWFPQSVPAATNATTLVVAVVVWPLSVLSLALFLRRLDRGFVMAAVALSGAFMAFPGIMLKWGILYPNLLGYSILPAYLAVLAWTIDRIVRGRLREWWPVVPVLLMGTAGVTLAHPNALVAAAVLILPAVLGVMGAAIASRESRGLSWVRWAMLAAAALVAVGIWYFARPADENSQWPPSLSQGHAVGEFLTNGFMDSRAQWVLSALTVIGAVQLLRTRTHRWVVVGWALIGFLWVVVAACEKGAYRSLMTGPWYNDSHRLAALAPVVGAVLAGVGLSAIVAWLVRWVTGGVSASGVRKAVAVVGVLAILATSFQLSRTRPMRDAAASVAHEFAVKPDSLLITADEQRVLDSLDDHVPANQTIIVNPWEGSALAYALEDRKVTSRHSLSAVPDKFEPIIRSFDDPAEKDDVCRTVRKTGAYWYLDFEDTLNIGAPFDGLYEGIDDAKDSPLVTPVVTSGPVGLYRVTGC